MNILSIMKMLYKSKHLFLFLNVHFLYEWIINQSTIFSILNSFFFLDEKYKNNSPNIIIHALEQKCFSAGKGDYMLLALKTKQKKAKNKLFFQENSFVTDSLLRPTWRQSYKEKSLYNVWRSLKLLGITFRSQQYSVVLS